MDQQPNSEWLPLFQSTFEVIVCDADVVETSYFRTAAQTF